MSNREIDLQILLIVLAVLVLLAAGPIGYFISVVVLGAGLDIIQYNMSESLLRAIVLLTTWSVMSIKVAVGDKQFEEASWWGRVIYVTISYVYFLYAAWAYMEIFV